MIKCRYGVLNELDYRGEGMAHALVRGVDAGDAASRSAFVAWLCDRNGQKSSARSARRPQLLASSDATQRGCASGANATHARHDAERLAHPPTPARRYDQGTRIFDGAVENGALGKDAKAPRPWSEPPLSWPSAPAPDLATFSSSSGCIV